MTLITLGFSLAATAKIAKTTQNNKQELLIKLAPGALENVEFMTLFSSEGTKLEKLTDTWIKIEGTSAQIKSIKALQHPAIEYVQPNYRIKLLDNYKVEDPLRRAALLKTLAKEGYSSAKKQDNLEIPAAPAPTTGTDPLFNQQWGMNDNNVKEAWKVTKGSPDMIVAVIDTGVDYTHEDLLPNMWRNAKEIPNNKIDDDNNGFVDDIVGWDFAANDNKPYDLAVDPFELLAGGGNPGHGTHCAGNVAARGDNGKGIAGVAPNVKIMALRFITEKGQGTTADAIKSIKYAVDNGAKVLSNSWGSEGEDPSSGEENKALRDAVQYAQDKGALFVAAAGNGHKGKGYDNDSDAAPAYPASYDHDIIISVAALDINNQLGSFSNWGLRTVDIGAPGVKVFSTTVENNYSDTVFDKYGITVTWDGTSMATPHVAGAAALYWSAHPEKTWQDVKAAILASAKKIPALTNKAVSGGKLDVNALLK